MSKFRTQFANGPSPKDEDNEEMMKITSSAFGVVELPLALQKQKTKKDELCLQEGQQTDEFPTTSASPSSPTAGGTKTKLHKTLRSSSISPQQNSPQSPPQSPTRSKRSSVSPTSSNTVYASKKGLPLSSPRSPNVPQKTTGEGGTKAQRVVSPKAQRNVVSPKAQRAASPKPRGGKTASTKVTISRTSARAAISKFRSDLPSTKEDQLYLIREYRSRQKRINMRHAARASTFDDIPEDTDDDDLRIPLSPTSGNQMSPSFFRKRFTSPPPASPEKEGALLPSFGNEKAKMLNWRTCCPAFKWRLISIAVHCLQYQQELRRKVSLQKQNKNTTQHSVNQPLQLEDGDPLLEARRKRDAEAVVSGKPVFCASEDLTQITPEFVKLLVSDVDNFFTPGSLAVMGSAHKAYEGVKKQLLSLSLYRPRNPAAPNPKVTVRLVDL